MISKLRSTLSGLSATGLFLGVCLLLAQPLQPVTSSSTTDSAEATKQESADQPVTFNVEAGLGSVKLNLTMPFYAAGRLLPARTEF